MRSWKCFQPLEAMERITRQELADRFEEILERIGVVILNEAGKDGHVLVPLEWVDADFALCSK